MQRWVIFLLILMIAACAPPADNTPSGPDLSQTASTANGELTVSLPQSWVTSEIQGVLAVANDSAALEGDALQNDDHILITIFPLISAVGDETIDLTALVADFVEGDAGEITETTIGDHRAAQVTSTGGDLDQSVIAIDFDGHVILVMAFARSNQISRFDATIRAIIATIAYTPGS